MSTLLVGSSAASNTLLLLLDKHPAATSANIDAFCWLQSFKPDFLHLTLQTVHLQLARHSAAAGVRVRVQDHGVSRALAIA
jgi:hypothetical protein